MSDFVIRSYRPGDEPGANHVCFKTGDYGKDGEPFYREDPDALGRIFVEPYLAYEPKFALILEDGQGVCGYAMGALDSRVFFDRYEREWRPGLCSRFPEPTGDPASWSRVQTVYSWYHHPDYFMPEPYDRYPSHLHIDLLPRAQGRGFGRRMLGEVMDRLRACGSPGAHLGVSVPKRCGFRVLQTPGFRGIGAGRRRSGLVYLHG